MPLPSGLQFLLKNLPITLPEGEEREKGTEKIFQEIKAENFPHMGKEPQMQEAQ